jgi:diadenosine tetraphosphate (Ap4A) HIT family hydrolase
MRAGTSPWERLSVPFVNPSTGGEQSMAPGEGATEHHDCEYHLPAVETSVNAGRCPFCERVLLDDSAHQRSTEHSIAFLDAFPSAPGHTLLIPRRHVSLLADLSADEHTDLFGLLREVVVAMQDIEARSIGVNDGALAGQTVPHVHLHVIPRRAGDVSDPRGGIRWVLPGTAAYWEPPTSC